MALNNTATYKVEVSGQELARAFDQAQIKRGPVSLSDIGKLEQSCQLGGYRRIGLGD